DRRVVDRNRQSRESDARLIHPPRSKHRGVLDLGAAWNLLDQPRLAVRQWQERLRVAAAAVRSGLTALALGDEKRHSLAPGQREVHLGGDVVVVESNRQVAAEVVVLDRRIGRRWEKGLKVFRDRRDAIRRNDVAGKWVADEPGSVRVRPSGLWVVDQNGKRAE